ncbi:MAG: RnfABCDGE type electron transport complex subunit D [Bacillales bacterium]|nr:RnfABCDGE type electron transport complex subunit D [Bacillales bacterium]
MAYIQSNAPYQRRKKSTLQIMIELGISLGIIWILAVVMSFVKLGIKYGLQSIFLMLTSLGTTLVCDVITTVLKNKKDATLKQKIPYDLVHNYSWITAMIFTLCCPVWTSYYVIIIGSIFATVIAKNVFGGFGKNIFNPAAAGRLFVLLTFDTSAPAGIAGVDSSTGATLTGVIQSQTGWLGSNALANFGVKDILFGTYFGAMGEVFSIALLVIGIVLALREVINWRIPAFYLGTIAVSSILIALVLGFNNPGLYVLYHLCAGGAMFAAIFMFTDPVTTPTSPLGNCLIGIIGGLLTVLIRIATNNVEGVVYSIMLINTISPAIDHFITAKTNKNTLVKSSVTFGTAALSVLLCVGVAWGSNGGREVYGINGIAIEDYNLIMEKLNLQSFKDKNYTIAPVEEKVENEKLYAPIFYKLGNGEATLTKPKDDVSYVEVTLDNQYAIIENKNEIGMMYCVRVNQSIETEYGEQKKYCIAYIGFENSTNKILNISVLQFAATQTAYSDKVNNALADLDYSSLTTDSLDSFTVSGATFTTSGLKTAITTAYEIHQANGGAK